ncbi:hypothetical protein SISNIDRAFT_56821 [Sistotremastrum niveocremeum HHB9708]|uniref:Uncharacterized protein n=1 Tax=Sistotremastrum niveocremeum HHB9708 TaxID=1314777 RepID=A0A164VDN2_9AGAM|nr:hypothetical protein SISNIDRAFT_56821 [Sistotremastrum niveocremeum HHB9708]
MLHEVEQFACLPCRVTANDAVGGRNSRAEGEISVAVASLATPDVPQYHPVFSAGCSHGQAGSMRWRQFACLPYRVTDNGAGRGSRGSDGAERVPATEAPGPRSPPHRSSLLLLQ